MPQKTQVLCRFLTGIAFRKCKANTLRLLQKPINKPKPIVCLIKLVPIKFFLKENSFNSYPMPICHKQWFGIGFD